MSERFVGDSRLRLGGRSGRPMGAGVQVGEPHPGQPDELPEPGNDLRSGALGSAVFAVILTHDLPFDA
jgi:hypothetical protein